MKREKIKSYEEMNGIMERDDYKELDKVRFEDRICYEIEKCIHAMKEAGETLEKKDMDIFVDSRGNCKTRILLQKMNLYAMR